MSATDRLDYHDVQRLGLLLLAVMDLSAEHFVLLRYVASASTWRVNVRHKHPAGCQCRAPLGCPRTVEQVVVSRDSPMLALDRALQWLRTSQARLDAGPAPTMEGA